MRGFLRPAVKALPSDAQTQFQGLSRHRKSKVAKAANTTFLKACQWGRGDVVATEIAASLEKAVTAKKKK
jgi:hypothetical protein